MAFCIFARGKPEGLAGYLCKSFANCKTNQQKFAFSLSRREYFKRDCQAKESNIGKHILQFRYWEHLMLLNLIFFLSFCESIGLCSNKRPIKRPAGLGCTCSFKFTL
jgi:hypothetical protein